MTSLSVVLPTKAFHQALSAAAVWLDPKSEDNLVRYRVLLTTHRAVITTTDGYAACLAFCPVTAYSETSDLPMAIDLTPPQVRAILAVFRPRKPRDDSAAQDYQQQVTLTVTAGTDDDTAEITDRLTLTDTSGLFDGETYVTDLIPADDTYPAVVTAAYRRLAASPKVHDFDPPIAPHITITTPGTYTQLIKTARALGASLVLERASISTDRALCVAHLNPHQADAEPTSPTGLVLFTEARGTRDDQTTQADSRMATLAELQALAEMELAPREGAVVPLTVDAREGGDG